MSFMEGHLIAFIFGFILDLIIGDPHSMPHPIRLIGNAIAYGEKKLLINTKDIKDEDKRKRQQLRNGKVLVVCLLLTIAVVTCTLLVLSYVVNVYIGIIIESIMTYYILATKCLRVESMKVYDALKSGSLEDSRKAVSMIVGRDTNCLNEEGITKAAIETVAENTSDGVIAPMIYTALGGPVLGFIYKGINTMDSMIGYKNDRYINFGRAAAKLDDVVNYIPARISALLMICATGICEIFGDKGIYSVKRGYMVFKRDRYNHSSPNSAQTESVCAGALGLKLAGDSMYFGKLVKKPFIGDEIRKPQYEDIKRANNLMYVTSFLCEILCGIILFIIL